MASERVTSPVEPTAEAKYLLELDGTAEDQRRDTHERFSPARLFCAADITDEGSS